MTDCPHCRSFAEENAKLTDELSGLMVTLRTQAAQLAQAKGELRKHDVADPKNAEIREVLRSWAEKTRRAKRKNLPAMDEGTDRWRLVKVALKREHGACGMDGLTRCLQAVEGAALLPYMSYGKRYASGNAKDRKDDVVDIFRTEKFVEDAIVCRARVLGASLEVLELAWEKASATADLYGALILERVSQVDQRVVASNVVPIRREGAA